MLKDINGFIFDMEGVFFKEYHMLPGAKEIIQTLKEKDIPFVFLTNISSKTSGEIHDILMRTGIYVDKEQIITCAQLVRNYLLENHKDDKIKVFGSKALKNFIYEKYRVGSKDIDVIVIGMDPNISIGDLSEIRKHIANNRKVIFTNPDYYTPTINGFDFECGVILELFKPHMKQKPIVIGKPSKYAFDYAIKKLDVPKEYVAMIGDTYETDIQGALNAGILPIHLQTSDEEYNTITLDAHEYKDLLELNSELKGITLV